MAKLGDGLGRSLAGDNVSVVPRRFPDVGEREQFPGQGIFVDQCPILVFVRLIEVALAQGLERFLHRIEWVGFTGEPGEAHELVKSSRQRALAGTLDIVKFTTREKPAHGHLIEGERAGLIDAQNGG